MSFNSNNPPFATNTNTALPPTNDPNPIAEAAVSALSSSQANPASTSSTTLHSGTWTTRERESFRSAILLHGVGNWNAVSSIVQTRTATQCKSHAQKYREHHPKEWDQLMESRVRDGIRLMEDALKTNQQHESECTTNGGDETLEIASNLLLLASAAGGSNATSQSSNKSKLQGTAFADQIQHNNHSLTPPSKRKPPPSFNPKKKKQCKAPSTPGVGKWTTQEEYAFNYGILLHGTGKWTVIATDCVKTRDASQVKSHAQKIKDYKLEMWTELNRRYEHDSWDERLQWLNSLEEFRGVLEVDSERVGGGGFKMAPLVPNNQFKSFAQNSMKKENPCSVPVVPNDQFESAAQDDNTTQENLSTSLNSVSNENGETDTLSESEDDADSNMKDIVDDSKTKNQEDGSIANTDLQESSTSIPNKKRSQTNTTRRINFPAKLHKILSCGKYNDIITWKEHGRSWKILDKERLESIVCPEYFKHRSIESFNRNVNGWGFKRISRAGPDHKSYYHLYFLRGRPELTKLIPRLYKHGRRYLDHQYEPNFYAMEPPEKTGAIAKCDTSLSQAIMIKGSTPRPVKMTTAQQKILEGFENAQCNKQVTQIPPNMVAQVSASMFTSNCATIRHQVAHTQAAYQVAQQAAVAANHLKMMNAVASLEMNQLMMNHAMATNHTAAKTRESTECRVQAAVESDRHEVKNAATKNDTKSNTSKESKTNKSSSDSSIASLIQTKASLYALRSTISQLSPSELALVIPPRDKEVADLRAENALLKGIIEKLKKDSLS